MNYYKHMLNIVGSLTGLFSDSEVPYLYYRVSENLFCKVFNAKNLSRSDVSVDASFDNIGIGIKTFVNGNGKSFQKIAEFNKDNISFRNLSSVEIIKKVAFLRNERIKTTKRIYKLDSMIYHCIIRLPGEIKFFECPMDIIEIDKIKEIKLNKNTLLFKDTKNEYSFNISKSTLYKRFITKNIIDSVKVEILKDPFDVLEKKFEKVKQIYYKTKITNKPFIILPLYSIKKDKKIVYPRSG
jgi:hypothetical protein